MLESIYLHIKRTISIKQQYLKHVQAINSRTWNYRIVCKQINFTSFKNVTNKIFVDKSYNVYLLTEKKQHLSVLKQMSSDSFKNVTYKLFTQK